MSKYRSTVRVLTVPASPETLSWLLLPLAFLAGGVMGHFVSGWESGHLTELLSRFETDSFSASFGWEEGIRLLWELLRTLGLAAIFSFSALGVAGLPVLLAVRGFTAAYAISALSRALGYRGLAMAALWVGGSTWIELVLLLSISIPGWVCAWALASGRRTGRPIPRNYLGYCVLICLMGIVLAVLYRWLISSYLTPALWARA